MFSKAGTGKKGTSAVLDERGVSLVLIALSIVVIFGFGALAIDIGHLYNVKDQLQIAADAAALAGAAKLDGTANPAQAEARAEAQRIAVKNVADVAYADVPAAGEAKFPGAKAGEAIPVALRPAQSDNNIVVGKYDATADTFTPADGKSDINAVMVSACRKGECEYQPRAQNWFARIFALLGAGFDASQISATAIAAKQNAPILPIAVNEYWLSSAPNGNRPYNPPSLHNYPNSFVRKNQVKLNYGDPDIASPTYGYTFGILGAYANAGASADDPNSYIDLDLRSAFHTGIDPATGTTCWYHVQDNSNGCGACMNSFTTGLCEQPSTGDVNSDKTGTNFEYFFNDVGYPSSRLLPSAVYEIKRNPLSGYPDVNNYTPANGNDPSNCPYATVPYYSESGGPVLSQSNKDGKTVPEVIHKGDKIVCGVYDGSHVGSTPKPLTIVGFVAIEVDGYENKNPKNIPLQGGNNLSAWNHNKSVLKDNAASMYGHAVSDIVQPDPTNGGADWKKGYCGFLAAVRGLQSQYFYVRLVGHTTTTVKYGMAQ